MSLTKNICPFDLLSKLLILSVNLRQLTKQTFDLGVVPFGVLNPLNFIVLFRVDPLHRFNVQSKFSSLLLALLQFVLQFINFVST